LALGGGWGEIRLGRDYTPHFWNHTVFDPFGTNGVGTTQTLNSSNGGTTTFALPTDITYLCGFERLQQLRSWATWAASTPAPVLQG
jgi:predicted porin